MEKLVNSATLKVAADRLAGASPAERTTARGVMVAQSPHKRYGPGSIPGGPITHTPRNPGIEVLEYLKFNYTYENGKVYRICEYFLKQVGKIQGGVEATGYRLYMVVDIKIGGRKGQLVALKMHHVIWFLCKGYWPIMEIDHKDRDTLNNDIDNLREVTSKQNSNNTKRMDAFRANNV